MRKSLFKITFCGLVFGFCMSGAAQAVNFNSLDGTVLKALIFHRATSVNGMVNQGTVAMLHGCGGLFATQGSRKGLLNARHQAMADLLVAEGYGAVFSDSLTPRGDTELRA